MTFSSPQWLVVGGLIAIALLVGAVAASRRRAAALAAAGVAAPGRNRHALGLWFSLAAVVVLAFAAAGPAASVPVTRAAGTVIVTVDVSNSMDAADVTPTRLAAAKRAANAFIAAQPSSVDIGVVAFNNGALTTDRPSSNHADATAAIDRLKIDGGTSLPAAILASLTAIVGRPVALNKDGTLPRIGYWGSATIVMFTDGEDEASPAALQAAATLAQNAGVHIETVGIGTAAGTTVVVQGFRLHTALDTGTLTSLAKTTGGSYHPAVDATQLDGIAKTINLRLSVHHQPLPLAGAVSGLAILLLAVGTMLTVRRTGRLV